MVDISTGRQRGIVPFVDETTGRLPDQYLPQGVIDLQGDLEQAVTDASASATAAKASETAAKASETAADSSAQAAAASAESAQTATESAASSKDAAARSASEASESAQAAEASKTSAASSASAAETSKTNAADSASAAKASETNAAASATAAQQAVDGFGLQVGTTTTGEPGTDAAVEIQKTGNKYTANFTIPRGDKGADGVNENVPIGSTSGVVAQATDAYPALPRKVQVHGRTVENLIVEPSKLVLAGKNFLQYASISVNRLEGKFTLNSEENQPIALHVGDNTLNFEGAYVAVINRVLPPGEYVLSYGKTLIAGLQFIATFSDGAQWKISASESQNCKKFTLAEYKTVSSMYIQVYKTAIGDYVLYPMLESGSTLTDWEPYKNIEELNLPSDISLAYGDTLTIDRDGTTQIVHAEGEPTVLENVTLPELPAPTFNVYTTGGYIQPTVDVDYERDVNLVLEALEAKIAALQVADKTN